MQYFQLRPASVASTIFLCVCVLRLHHGTRVHSSVYTCSPVSRLQVLEYHGSGLRIAVDHLACPPCLWLDRFKLCRFLSEYCVATTATHPPHGWAGARALTDEYVTSRLEQQEQKLAAVEAADKAQKHSTAAKRERGRVQTLVELHGKARVVWAAGSATAGAPRS